MGDIFDQVAPKKPTGDIFDQVTPPTTAPLPNAGLAPPSGAKVTMDSGGGPMDALAHVVGAGSDLLSRAGTEASEVYQHPLEALKGAAKGTVGAMGAVLPSVQSLPHTGQDVQNNPYVSPKTKQLLASGTDETPQDLSGGIVSGLMQPQNPAQQGGYDLASLLAAARGGYETIKGAQGVLGMGENPARIALTRPTQVTPNAPEANLVDGVYSKPGSQIASSLRGSSRFDVPAAAANAHPAIAEGLADRGISAKDFQGRNGPQALQSGIDNAIDIQEARAKAAIDPTRGDNVDPQKLAKNPELASRFSSQQLDKGITYGDIDAERIKMNKELRRANFYSRDPSAQYAVADPLANVRDAVNQARDMVYGHAQDVTGYDLRPLKQTESNLIKLSDLAETTKNGLSSGAAQNETASPLAKGINTIKKIAAIKKNPASSLASLANSPETLDLDGFNSNMRKAFSDVKAAPGSVLKNGRLIEPGPGVLTPPNGATPPEPNRQLPLSLEPNKPGYELTPPNGKTPPEIQPRQSALPLTPGEHGFELSPSAGSVPPAPANQYGLFNDPKDLQPTVEPNGTSKLDAIKNASANAPRSLGAASATIPDNFREMLSGVHDPMLADIEPAQRGRATEVTDKYPAKAIEATRDPFAAPDNSPKMQADGEISWPDSYKNPPKGGGGNYAASDLEMLKKRMGIETGGGHAGNGVASVEEINRPGSNYVVSKHGKLTYHGKSFAPEETPVGAAHVTVLPNGEFRVNEGTMSPLMEQALKNGLKK